MNRKLLAMNIALGIGVIYTGVKLHDVWVAAKARQAGMPGKAPKTPLVIPPTALPKQPTVAPAGYIDVAQKDLFDPSRNPNLPPPPAPAPLPPRNPPPLPSYHGMMDFGDPQGPIALVTETTSPRHQEFHAGEKIGEFKLLAFDRREMTLEWEGKTLHKLLNDSEPEKSAPKPQAGGVEPLVQNGVVPGQAPEQQQQVEQPRQNDLGPGPQMTDTVKACQAGDTSAAGTVNGGFRKEINVSPMGPQCLWRAVK